MIHRLSSGSSEVYVLTYILMKLLCHSELPKYLLQNVSLDESWEPEKDKEENREMFWLGHPERADWEETHGMGWETGRQTSNTSTTCTEGEADKEGSGEWTEGARFLKLNIHLTLITMTKLSVSCLAVSLWISQSFIRINYFWIHSTEGGSIANKSAMYASWG